MTAVPGLGTLVTPLAASDFRERYWKRAVFHGEGSPELRAAIDAAIGDASPGDLIDRSRHFVAIGGAAPAGTTLPRAEALEAYATRGATLYLRMADSFALCRWTEGLARELGELPIGVTSIFAVRGAHGTPAHLDWNENFTVQLRGTKRWRVSRGPAQFLPHPVTNWNLGDAPPLYAAAGPLPAEMPAEAMEYRMAPGSVLYVPRGFIHQVSAIDAGESVSVNLSLPPSPWAVILGTLLTTRLLEDPAFREGLTGAFGAGWGREETLARLPAMLTGLGHRADELGADLRAILDDPARLADYLQRRGLPKV